MEFLSQAGLALGRDFEKLSIENVCKPALRRAELGRDKGNNNPLMMMMVKIIMLIIDNPQIHWGLSITMLRLTQAHMPM